MKDAGPANKATLLSTIVGLWPHMWPGSRPDLKRRVFFAFILLVLGKLVTVLMPFTFKWATDSLVARTPASVRGDRFMLVSGVRLTGTCSMGGDLGQLASGIVSASAENHPFQYLRGVQ